MGKQWLLCKVAGDGTAGGCNGTTNTKSGGKSRKRRGDRHVSSSSSSSSSGCMSAIFHLFDIQHHHFPFHQPSFISESTISIHQEHNNIILKGVEAPRNSLELEEQEKTPPSVVEEEEVTSSSSSSSTRKQLKQETNFNTPVRDIQIKTKRSRLMDINDASSECSSSSPGTKTPSLVARLMGLDLLPENSSPRPSLSSPRPSSSSSHAATPLNPLSKLSSLKNNYTRSLPVTPRASTTARPSTEVDYHHRLSLQVNKDNKRRYDESTSEYAKQIAKQVRENISRRVGADITNTSKKKEHRRDEFLVVLKPKRPSPPSSATPFIEKSRKLDQGHGRGKENEPTPPSCSPRLKLSEIKKNNLMNKPISNMPKSSPLSSSSSSTTTEVINAPSSLPSTTSRSPPPIMMMKEQVQMIIKPMKKVQKCKKPASEKYDLRLRKLHHQNEEEPKCIKKCNNMKKSTPLSNHLVNVNTTTKFISFKKDIIVSPSSTIASPQKQVTYESITQLPSCQSRSYNTKKTINLSVQHDITTNGNGPTTTTTTTGASFSDHFDYISRILSHAGIEKTTPISITHWYSPSHPLHPSILENLNHPKTVTNRLIFDVVDELLVEILKPYISLKPWVSVTRQTRSRRNRMFGRQLIETLCDKISCFPEANCQVLEDIDGLIESDMKSNTKVIGDIAFEEEAEELVAELERDMVDTLVGEMAAAWITCHVGSM